jgi:glycerol-3-phosphate dehydrogenase (NAD(P)+)
MQPDCVSVIGSGSWGTALAILLCRNIDRVLLWGRDAGAMEEMSTERCNNRYLPGIAFPENLEIQPDFNSLVNDNLSFVMVVPSHSFRPVLKDLKESIIRQGYSSDKATIIWGTKGFDTEQGSLLSDVVGEIFGSAVRSGVISGPSFARETASSLPTALTLASEFSTNAEAMANWFRNQTTRVYFSDDVVGVQLGGAIKNVMAIAAGISDGLGYGANARAALITRGLSELTRLGLAMGGKAETFMGLTGVGDLILTCTDDQSRNRRFGMGIGAGKSLEQVCEEIGQEIEGINTVRELIGISKKLHVDMPITEQVYRIIHHDTDPATAVQLLLRRDPKAEST